jgi:hypothetical protein
MVVAAPAGAATIRPASSAAARVASSPAAARPLTDPPGSCLPSEEGTLKVDSETGEIYACEYVQDPEFCAYLWIPWQPIIDATPATPARTAAAAR